MPNPFPIFFSFIILACCSFSLKICPQVFTGEKKFDFWQSGKPIEIGKDERSEVKHIRFRRPFCQTPEVQISMNGFDVSQDYLQILRVSAKNVTKEGFDVIISTSEEAKVFGAMVNWIAFQIGGNIE